jgi:nitrite reductase/ring-hydroxylating ferredoxin subunit
MNRIFKCCAPFFVLFLLLPGSSCKKETTCNGVPNVSVYFQIQLNMGYPTLNVPGNNETFTGGYNGDGVLVYRYTSNQFYAYDCTCPYDGQSNSKAIINTSSVSSLYATCPVCGSSFLLSTGSPSKGPSTCPLKAYAGTSYDAGSNTVTVSN